MPLAVNLCPVAAHRQQQSPRHPHRPVGQQTPPQLRRRLLQRLQQVRREPQQLRCQHFPHRRRQNAVQRPRRHHQHRRSGHGVPQGAAGIQQSRHLGGPALHAHPDRRQLAPQAVAGRRPEHHRHHPIGRPGAARQQPHAQHTPGHGAGPGAHQQRQPENPRLSAEGDHREDHPRRDLHRQQTQKAAPRQKHRHGVGPAQKGPQGITPSPQRNARKAGSAKEQQVVHERIENKHAVYIHGGHGAAPLLVTQTIIGQRTGKTGRKKEAGPISSDPPQCSEKVFSPRCASFLCFLRVQKTYD